MFAIKMRTFIKNLYVKLLMSYYLHINICRKANIVKLNQKWQLGLLALGSCLGMMLAVPAQASVPDISEWQGKLSKTQVKNLKGQTQFVINRVQYGSNYEDIHHKTNENLYVKYGVPFGSYDFATFTSKSGAIQEAKDFYRRSNKHTTFYVLDFETTSMSASAANTAVKAWYSQMRKLTKKHLLFYSYQSFATTYANSARKKFDAQWIANYSYKPTVSFSLWQYTDNYYLKALGKYVDNNRYGKKWGTVYHPLKWWQNKATTVTKPTTTKTTKPVTYAYGSYTKGQHVFLRNAASRYVDNTTVPTSAKQKYYRVNAVKSYNRSRSKQAVYLAGLNKWVLCQDVTGYWVGQHGSYTLKQNSTVFSDINLKHATTTKLPKGKTYAGKLVKSGLYYRIKLSRGGYISAQVSRSDHAYIESVPSSKRVVAKQNIYTHRSSKFTKGNRVALHKKNKALKIVAVHKRSTGSRYFETNKGNYFTANKLYVKTK